MATVHEALAAVTADEQKRAVKAESADRFKKFYSSPAWKKARWRFMASQPKPLRCAACGRTSRETALAVDHVVPLRRDWSRRLDPTNFQILCTPDCNYFGKGSRDDDWRDNKIEAQPC
jgi:5-methylcytosine-specific restriction protein A